MIVRYEPEDGYAMEVAIEREPVKLNDALDLMVTAIRAFYHQAVEFDTPIEEQQRKERGV